MNKDSRIYIAGHNGYVGKNVLKHFENKGFTNLLYENHSDLNLENYEDVEYFFYKNKPEYVVICAAKVGGIKANMSDPYGFLYHNLAIQNNIIDVCLKNDVKKCIFLGSSCIYPKLNKETLSEEDMLRGEFEETNLGYSLAKVAGLKLTEFANKQFKDKCRFITLIPPNLCGVGDSFDLENCHVFTALIKKMVDAKYNKINDVEIWGTGNPKREFMNVRDLADGIFWSLENLEKTETFLNIGTGEDIAIRDLANKIKKIVGYKGRLIFDFSKPDGIYRKCLNVEKINKLGWKSTISLDDSIKEVVNEYILKRYKERKFNLL